MDWINPDLFNFTILNYEQRLYHNQVKTDQIMTYTMKITNALNVIFKRTVIINIILHGCWVISVISSPSVARE